MCVFFSGRHVRLTYRPPSASPRLIRHEFHCVKHFLFYIYFKLLWVGAILPPAFSAFILTNKSLFIQPFNSILWRGGGGGREEVSVAGYSPIPCLVLCGMSLSLLA